MHIPISDRARRFGYIIWPKALDEEVAKTLRDKARIRVVFEGLDVGEKSIDWKHRRISVGPRRTRTLATTASVFQATINADGALDVRVV